MRVACIRQFRDRRVVTAAVYMDPTTSKHKSIIKKIISAIFLMLCVCFLLLLWLPLYIGNFISSPFKRGSTFYAFRVVKIVHRLTYVSNDKPKKKKNYLWKVCTLFVCCCFDRVAAFGFVLLFLFHAVSLWQNFPHKYSTDSEFRLISCDVYQTL